MHMRDRATVIFVLATRYYESGDFGPPVGFEQNLWGDQGTDLKFARV